LSEWSHPILGRELVNRLESANAGVVHQDIEPPESCRRLLDDAAAFLVATDIRDRPSRGAFAPKGVELAKRQFQRCRIPPANKHAGAFPDQSLGNAQSNAPCAARYQSPTFFSNSTDTRSSVRKSGP